VARIPDPLIKGRIYRRILVGSSEALIYWSFCVSTAMRVVEIQASFDALIAFREGTPFSA